MNGHGAPTVITQPQISAPLIQAAGVPQPQLMPLVVPPQVQLNHIPASQIPVHQVIHQPVQAPNVPVQVPLAATQQQQVATMMQNQTNLAQPQIQLAQPQVNMTQPMVAIREELYPCGIPRAIFQPGNGTLDNSNQMDLLKRMPNNPPPNPFSMSIVTRDPVSSKIKIKNLVKQIKSCFAFSGSDRFKRFIETVVIRFNSSFHGEWIRRSVSTQASSDHF